jgi:carboxypeptidase Taq
MGAHYDTMIHVSREVNDLNRVSGLLSWDQETFMPRKGAATRGRQMAMLSGMAHERFTSREMGEAIRGAETESLTGLAAVNLRELKRTWERSTRVPVELVREMAETSAAAKMAWRDAREKDEFALFAPFLARQVELKKRYADAVGYQAEPYDALLDDYEQGMTAAELSRVFAGLREQLVPLAGRIRDARAPRADFLRRKYPREAQERMCVRVLDLIGYDFDGGRMDVAPHPFTISFGPGDVRVTTRFDESFFNTAFFGTVHEGGHALYDQGLLPEHEGTPAGDSVSLGIHESQSRLWENMVARSRPFWEFFFPVAREHFPGALGDVTVDEFYRAVNLAQPSLIRVEADEVYYSLHIMLRFEMERDLFRGTLRPEDTPAAWKDRMQEYVGIRPATDREGVLQDIHWSMGLMGYFPTYALGNLYAAQFMATARRALPDLDGMVGRGELRPLLGWLRKQIHEPGMTWPAGELVQRVTGKPLDPSFFTSYLEAKYGEVYGI